MKNKVIRQLLFFSAAAAVAVSVPCIASAEEESYVEALEGENEEALDTTPEPEYVVPAEVVQEQSTQESAPAETQGDILSGGELSGAPVAPETTVVPAAAETPVLVDELSGDPVETPESVVTPEPAETPESAVTPEPTLDPMQTLDIGTDVEPTPDPTATPEVTPDPTATPEITPDPSIVPETEITVTPAPVTIKPEQELSPDAVDVISMISELDGAIVTSADKKQVEAIRSAYAALSDSEKAQTFNYDRLVELEEAVKAAQESENKKVEEELAAEMTKELLAALQGTPIYYTDMISNLHAGKEFYLNSLKEYYHITFAEDFPAVMDEIEYEYKKKNGLLEEGETIQELSGGVTTSADQLLVRNWQDILAIYIYEHHKKGETEFVLDASAKAELAAIFEELNPVVRDSRNVKKVSYGNRHISYYIKKNKLTGEDKAFLEKYVETDCELLCAVVTAAKGFVRQSVGEDVSEERVNVITSAFSLIGKVGYFWGGKSEVVGDDPYWGQAARVTAEGSRSTGTVRAYGLDCSGFVTWAVINGYKDQNMIYAVGSGTSDQWEKANVVSELDAQPGDLVFQRGPESGSNNHVGILCGKTEGGDWIAVHCSSSKNGVTVGEAYSASFRYIRQPDFFPTEEEVKAMEDGVLTDGETVSDSEEVVLYGSLQESLSAGEEAAQNTKKKKNKVELVDSYPTLDVLKPEEILVDNSEVTMF